MIDYTLGVVSPTRKDLRVRAAQTRLERNRFGDDYLRGTVDGEFGEATGRACVRAKFHLGYKEDELLPIYGPRLDAYLSGEKPLPLLYRRRRKLRLARDAKNEPLRLKALREAMKWRGYKESPPGSNHQKFGEWYGYDRQPWCAMFVSWCYVVGAKSQAFAKHERYAYVPYIVNDARAGRNSLQVTAEPQPGDIVCYDWDGGVADHVGLYVRPLGPGTFEALEGNTAVGNDSNGGEVMFRQRRTSQVEAFVRVGK